MRKDKMEGEVAIGGPGDRWTIGLLTAQVRTHVTETWVDRGRIRPENLS